MMKIIIIIMYCNNIYIAPLDNITTIRILHISKEIVERRRERNQERQLGLTAKPNELGFSWIK